MMITTINGVTLEKILTQVRYAILQNVMKDEGGKTVQLFHTALSIYCFNSEFVYYETSEEKQQIIIR